MTRTRYISLLILILSIAVCSFTACSMFGGSEEEPAPSGGSGTEAASEEEDTDFDHPEYANEQEEADVKEKKSPPEDFVGRWTAKSDRAEYLYGNIDLTISESGKWSGNITEEDFSGDWEYNGTGITLSSDIINADLFFATDGVLMFRDADNPEILIALFPVGE